MAINKNHSEIDCIRPVSLTLQAGYDSSIAEFLDHFSPVDRQINKGAGFHEKTEVEELLSSVESKGQPIPLIKEFTSWLRAAVKPEIQMLPTEVTEAPTYEISGHALNLILAISHIMDGRGAMKRKTRAILKLLHESTGCDTVAITTKKHDEFVLYASVGQAEILTQEMEKQACSDESANPPFQCICEAFMIAGAGDILPYRTEVGSFWINSGEKLAYLSRMHGTRNNLCNPPGIESIARIPLAINGERFGTLHLNDHRRDRFRREDITVFEVVGTMIAMIFKQEITEAQLHEKMIRLYNFIHYDGITSLPNRIFLENHLQEHFSRKTPSNDLLALLLIDIDRFKNIIDTFGDNISNEVLCSVAKRLKQIAGWSSIVTRWEADVFILVVEKPISRIIIEDMVREVLKFLRMPFNAGNHDFFLTASVGIAYSPEDGRDLGALVGSASIAMGLAKGLGGNGYRFCTPEMKTSDSELKAMERSLRKALKEHQFILHYQSQVNLSTEEVVGFEALLRWRHPTKGTILPEHFIPLAEKTGLIIPIGEWVLQTACKQNKKWQIEGLAPVRIAVNISALQFQQIDFPQIVSKTLDSVGLAPQFLELEITESSVMKSGEAAITVLNNLKRTGLRIAIDDFGSGYSSLAYLKDFPIDILKVDQSFIRDMTICTKNSAIVRSIIAMARNMNIEVIAKGVETEAQRCYLREEGCEVGQGFLLGRPVPAEEMHQFMKSTMTEAENQCAG